MGALVRRHSARGSVRLREDFEHALETDYSPAAPSLFLPDSVDEELDEELRYPIEREIEKNIDQGMSPQEARDAVLKSMSGLQQRKEECRDSRGIRWLNDLLQDVSFSIRTLSKIPGFTLVAVLVLALAIGANTAVFTVVNGVLLRPLPFPDSDRLTLVSSVPKNLFFDPGPIMVDRDYFEFRQHNHSFQSLASVAGVEVTLTRHGEPTVLTASVVASDFFRVLRVYPALGRDFLSYNQPDTHVAVLSNRLWIGRFHGDKNVVGKP